MNASTGPAGADTRCGRSVRGSVDGVGVEDDEVWDRRFASRLMELVDRAHMRLGGDGNRLAARILGHLGCGIAEVPNIARSYEAWEHLNVHRGVMAYLAEHDPDAEWFGISGMHAGM